MSTLNTLLVTKRVQASVLFLVYVSQFAQNINLHQWPKTYMSYIYIDIILAIVIHYRVTITHEYVTLLSKFAETRGVLNESDY